MKKMNIIFIAAILFCANLNAATVLLIDNFDDGNLASPYNSWTWGQGNSTGTVSFSVDNGAGITNSKAIRAAMALPSGGWNHIVVDGGASPALTSLTNRNGTNLMRTISFWYKITNTLNMKVIISSSLAAANGYINYIYPLSISNNWTYASIPLLLFQYNGSGTPGYSLSQALSTCVGIKWETTTAGDSGILYLDNVSFNWELSKFVTGNVTNTNALRAIDNGNPPEAKALVLNTLVDVSKGNPEPIINFDIPNSVNQKVNIHIYTISGMKIRSLVKGVDFSPGAHSETWDLLDDNGADVASGIYVINVVIGSKKQTFKIMLLR